MYGVQPAGDRDYRSGFSQKARGVNLLHGADKPSSVASLNEMKLSNL